MIARLEGDRDEVGKSLSMEPMRSNLSSVESRDITGWPVKATG